MRFDAQLKGGRNKKVFQGGGERRAKKRRQAGEKGEPHSKSTQKKRLVSGTSKNYEEVGGELQQKSNSRRREAPWRS